MESGNQELHHFGLLSFDLVKSFIFDFEESSIRAEYRIA
jgi:hypothetical protein